MLDAFLQSQKAKKVFASLSVKAATIATAFIGIKVIDFETAIAQEAKRSELTAHS